MKHLSKILIGFLLFFGMITHSVLAAVLTKQVTVYNYAPIQLGAPTIVKQPTGTGMMYAIPTPGTAVGVTGDAAAHSSIQIALSRTAPLIIQYAYDSKNYCQFSLKAVNNKPEITVATSIGNVKCAVENGAMIVNVSEIFLKTSITVVNNGSQSIAKPTYVGMPPLRTGIFGHLIRPKSQGILEVQLSSVHPLVIQYQYDSNNYCQFSLIAVNGAPRITETKSSGIALCSVVGAQIVMG